MGMTHRYNFYGRRSALSDMLVALAALCRPEHAASLTALAQEPAPIFRARPSFETRAVLRAPLIAPAENFEKSYLRSEVSESGSDPMVYLQLTLDVGILLSGWYYVVRLQALGTSSTTVIRNSQTFKHMLAQMIQRSGCWFVTLDFEYLEALGILPIRPIHNEVPGYNELYFPRKKEQRLADPFHSGHLNTSIKVIHNKIRGLPEPEVYLSDEVPLVLPALRFQAKQKAVRNGFGPPELDRS